MSFALPHTKPVFKHQPDATIDQDNPVSGQKYEWKDPEGKPLGTQKNVRILSINVNCTWTVQPTPLEIWLTIDGQPLRFFVNDPDTVTEYYARLKANITPAAQQLTTTEIINAKAFMLEGRTAKIEAEITGGTVSKLNVRVKYAKME